MPFPQAHALVIGVGSYAHAPQLDVPITADDAQAVAAVLCSQQYCAYPTEQVMLLTDAAASRDGILAALDRLAARTGKSDLMVVFYAGHGIYGDRGYYLTTHDSRLADHKVVDSSGLHEAELIEKLRTIKAKRLLLLVNACHAGELSPVLGEGEQPPTGNPLPPQVSAALLSSGEGRVIISACRENQYSFIGSGSLTLFTQALVDGLQGKGVSSNRGYISVFDLYTHLYFALDEAVPRMVPEALRQKYGERQEPELSILKGVGPFAVGLYRGATTLGDFDATGTPPEGTAMRQVNPAYSQAMLRQHQQSISGNARVGTAIAGDVHGNVNQQGDTIDTGGGDNIHVGDISGSSGIAIGRGARSSVRNIDKREGTFVSGDQFDLSGNFSGAILNIKSTLSSVSQRIGAAQHGDAATKAQLQTLIAQLSAELQKVPADKASDAEAVAEAAKAAMEQATKAKPNKIMVQISAEGLKQAAQNLAAVLPAVLDIAGKLASAITKFIS